MSNSITECNVPYQVYYYCTPDQEREIISTTHSAEEHSLTDEELVPAVFTETSSYLTVSHIRNLTVKERHHNQHLSGCEQGVERVGIMAISAGIAVLLLGFGGVLSGFVVKSCAVAQMGMCKTGAVGGAVALGGGGLLTIENVAGRCLYDDERNQRAQEVFVNTINQVTPYEMDEPLTGYLLIQSFPYLTAELVQMMSSEQILEVYTRDPELFKEVYRQGNKFSAEQSLQWAGVYIGGITPADQYV